MSQLPIPAEPYVYIGDQTKTLEQLKTAAEPHTNIRDDINSFFRINPLKNDKAINWDERRKAGLIDENGIVKQTGTDILFGTSQEELQLAYETWRQKELKQAIIPLNAKRKASDFSPIEINNKTSSATIAADIDAFKTLERNRDALITSGGQELYDKLGPNPTNTQILGAIAKRNEEIAEPERTRKEETFNDEMITRKDTRKLAKDRFNLEETQYAEAQNFREWQARDRSARDKFQQEEQTRRLQYENTNKNADRNLQIQLAEMNRNERGEIRREERRRDAKKDRQLMLLQLINGLKQVGQGFGG